MPELEIPQVAAPTVAIIGATRRFPVHRIYCIGLNYADHVREMGCQPERSPPVFFMKPADAIVATDAAIAYPPRTSDLHHEVELVVALGKGGHNITREHALEHVFGYAVGNDLTRRDLQAEAKRHGRPWDVSKGFDQSAPVGPLRPAAHGHLARGRIWLTVNGKLRQDSDLEAMLWRVPEVIAELSSLFTLQPGDLIFTGTPSGVGPLKPGDRVEAGIEGLGVLRNTIAGAGS